MTDQQQHHPITPPPELVKQWKRTAPHQSNEHEHYHYITLCAAQWGANTELTECCKCIYDQGWFANPEHRIAQLRAARRPKPPSLKEQACKLLESYLGASGVKLTVLQRNTIRRALEDSND